MQMISDRKIQINRKRWFKSSFHPHKNMVESSSGRTSGFRLRFSRSKIVRIITELTIYQFIMGRFSGTRTALFNPLIGECIGTLSFLLIIVIGMLWSGL